MGNLFQKMMPTATKIVQQMQQNNNQQQQPVQQPQSNGNTQMQQEKLEGIAGAQQAAIEQGQAVAAERNSRVVQPQQPATPTQPQQPAVSQKQQFYPGTATTPQNVVTPAPTPTPVPAAPVPAPAAPAAPVVPPAQPQKQMPIINTSDPLSGMNAVLSLADEEQERKKSLLSQRILALGDAFRQIGNIHNAVNGAPAQQFNNPVLEERQRYQQEKAVRDNDRYKQMAMRQSQKMNELKAKQMEDENEYRKSSIAMRKAEHDRLMGRQKLDERKQDFLEDLKKKQYELDKAYKEHKMSHEDYVAQSGRINAQANWMKAEKYQPGSGNGYDGYEKDESVTYVPGVVDPVTKEVKKWNKEVHTKRTRTAAGSNNHRKDPYGNNSKDHKNDPYS